VISWETCRCVRREVESIFVSGSASIGTTTVVGSVPAVWTAPEGKDDLRMLIMAGPTAASVMYAPLLSVVK
jgi:hypothetical protein